VILARRLVLLAVLKKVHQKRSDSGFVHVEKDCYAKSRKNLTETLNRIQADREIAERYDEACSLRSFGA